MNPERNERQKWDSYEWLREFAAAAAVPRGPLPALRDDQILAWADAHFARTGAWPNRIAGREPRGDS